MGRKADWIERWEATHTVKASEVLISLLSKGADMARVCFEFDTDTRAIRHWCKRLGVEAPQRVTVLSEEERERRAQRARLNLTKLPSSRTELTVNGETLSRYDWFKRCGGTIGRYYGQDDAEVAAYIQARYVTASEAVSERVPRKNTRYTNSVLQRHRLNAALPYAKAALAGRNEAQIREAVQQELSKITKAKERANEAEPEQES